MYMYYSIMNEKETMLSHPLYFFIVVIFYIMIIHETLGDIIGKSYCVIIDVRGLPLHRQLYIHTFYLIYFQHNLY